MKDKPKPNPKKPVHDAKGKASFDQNGQGSAPKYGQAGDTPNESGKGMDRVAKGKAKS